MKKKKRKKKTIGKGKDFVFGKGRGADRSNIAKVRYGLDSNRRL